MAKVSNGSNHDLDRHFFAEGDLTAGCNHNENHNGDAERIWTVEGNEQSSSRSSTLNGRLRNYSGDALSCDNVRLGDSSITELHSRVYPSQSQTTSPRLGIQQQSHHRHHLHAHLYHHHPLHQGPTSCEEAGSLQVQSSQRRTIKANSSLQFSASNSSDPNQNTANRADYTSGRVASFKRETKTAQTLAAVVGGFIICWLPFFVAYVIGPFIPKDIISSGLMDALIWLGWGNSAINPFIYAFYSPDFRSAFWRLTLHKVEGLCRTKRGGRHSPRRYDDTMTGALASS